MKQGYNARLDDSMGARSGSKTQSMKSRRDESEGMEKSSGKKKFSGNKSSAQGSMMMGGKMKKMYESGGMIKAMLKDPKQRKFAMQALDAARDTDSPAVIEGRAGRGKGENVAGSGMKMKYQKGGKIRGVGKKKTDLGASGMGRVMKQTGQIVAENGAMVPKKKSPKEELDAMTINELRRSLSKAGVAGIGKGSGPGSKVAYDENRSGPSFQNDLAAMTKVAKKKGVYQSARSNAVAGFRKKYGQNIKK
tara:strand:+ start:2801 stop:3547 length:747 start_codon:yes stop_codon:yes gene_type:complete